MIERVGFGFCLLLVVFLSAYKLTETPPTWMDEGVITQVARNIALGSGHVVQIAPEVYQGGSFISTAYPVTFPVSLSFKFFGIGILQSRVVMAIFIIVLFSTLYFYLRNRDEYHDSPWFLIATLLLIATFAPLYGHGKNVLGEIPGLCYLFLSFICIEKICAGSRNFFLYALGSLFLGLAIVTKPIYILIAPAAVCAVFIYRKKMFVEKKDWSIFLGFLALPVLIWLFVQFKGDSLQSIYSLYSNPNASSGMFTTVVGNLKRFVTELQPMYTLGLFAIWTVTGIIRYRRKKMPGPTELIAWIFSLLILLAFLRTAGFYRYFFQTEFLVLVFFAGSLKEVLKNKFHKPLLVVLALLIGFQTYQLVFKSWIVTHADSKKSETLQKHIGKLSPDKSVLFYQAPETVNFLKPEHTNYYQFIKITETLVVGEAALEVLKNNATDIIVTNAEFASNPLFAKYLKRENVDRYVILRK